MGKQLFHLMKQMSQMWDEGALIPAKLQSFAPVYLNSSVYMTVLNEEFVHLTQLVIYGGHLLKHLTLAVAQDKLGGEFKVWVNELPNPWFHYQCIDKLFTLKLAINQ